jgi:alkylhydroperoxidase family enzyme
LARRLGWSEEQIKDLANFEQRADFTDKEKVALRLAERVTRDARAVDDPLWTELRRHFDEGEVVELLSAIGLFNYFNRFNDALQMEPTASPTPSGGEGPLSKR